jgi:hypothetical protein
MELKDRIKGEETNDCQTEGGENRQLPTENFDDSATKLFHLNQSISNAFPLNFQLTLQTEAQWALEATQRIIGDDGTILLAVLNKVGLTTFGRFFGMLGLTASQFEHGLHSFYEEWDEDEVDCPPDIPSGIEWFVDEINRTKKFAKDSVLSASKVLSLSKESLINDFVIPFYKIPKSNSFDLEDLAEDAFFKGMKTLRVGAKNCHTIYDCFNQLDTADFVSIFEYFLEGLDLQQSTELTKFQTEGLEAGYSLHCLRQYPSGFPKGERSFPRVFIHRQDGEGKMNIDEVKVFIEGLPTELDRKAATLLLEHACSWNKEFAEGKSFWSAYDFDGVKALADFLDIPYQSGTFGSEVAKIFREFLSENIENFSLENFENEAEELLRTKFGTHPDWTGILDFGFVWTLSFMTNVPKKVLRYYRRIANSCHNDFVNGNY